ncbi:hypothetical protein AMECASPLE_038438 [Ameca splendens]|uniref:Uncharacterized protein n=1 Tax=Ameca splendens TaxID=208324 RepID=A0ABV0Y832_9TELE
MTGVSVSLSNPCKCLWAYMHKEKDIANPKGLVLPSFLQHYWAANVHKILYWTDNPTTHQPAWANTKVFVTQISLHTWLCTFFPPLSNH